MKGWLFFGLSVLLMLGSLVFFWKCIGFLTQRNYVGALVLMLIGISIISVGKEMARLALIHRD